MLEELFSRMSRELYILSQDIYGMAHSVGEGGKPEDAPRKSLEPITRLRKDKEELEKVENTDPGIQFIKDKAKDIIR